MAWRMWQEGAKLHTIRAVGRMNHAETFFAAAAQICHDISFASIEALASELDRLRERKGRLFLLGVGGSAANCSHAVNDFRKLCGIETYSPVDNVSELTARTNDEGWDTVFAAWLEISHLNDKDAILVYSVGRRRCRAQYQRQYRQGDRSGQGAFGQGVRDRGPGQRLCGQARRRGGRDSPGQSGLGHPPVGGFPGRGLALSRQPSSLAAQADEMVSRARGLRPAVFLDRDGVIVIPEFRDRRSFAPRRLADLRLYPDAAASLQEAQAGGVSLGGNHQPAGRGKRLDRPLGSGRDACDHDA